jgi:hypothetical protein
VLGEQSSRHSDQQLTCRLGLPVPQGLDSHPDECKD